MSKPEIDDAYEIDSRIPDGEQIMARYAAVSGDVARRADARLDLAYGRDARQRLDVFPAAGVRQPAMLFFHGGYWTGGAKESRRFPAPAWNALGIAWVPVEYRLTPASTLDDTVADARGAVAWLHANAASLGLDAHAIHVAGNSAGGHIAGMLAATGWQGPLGLPDDVVKSATAISGLFDLAPLRDTFVNDWLQLDDDSIARNSPIRLPPRRGLPMVVAWGGRESDAFHQQSLDYAEVCRAAGAFLTVADRPDANHFTIIGDLAETRSRLFTAMADLVTVRP